MGARKKFDSQNSQLALECETQDICSLLLLIQAAVATGGGDLDFFGLSSTYIQHSSLLLKFVQTFVQTSLAEFF